jgi:hypothetical protein
MSSRPRGFAARHVNLQETHLRSSESRYGESNNYKINRASNHDYLFINQSRSSLSRVLETQNVKEKSPI